MQSAGRNLFYVAICLVFPLGCQAGVTPFMTPSALPTSAAASSLPVPAISPSPLPTAAPMVTGSIYDLDGALVEGARVNARSLDATVPFDQSVDATGGQFAIATLPDGVNVQIEVTKPGWSVRSRVGVFSRRHPVQLDFGAPNFTGDGAPYFLTDLPEVTRTEPITDGVLKDVSSLNYRMTLSTPLDAENQRRFASALRVVALPPETAAPDPIATREDLIYPSHFDTRGIGRFQIKEGTTFRQRASRMATVTWNAAGTEATFAFNAPLLAGRAYDATYAVLFEAGDTPIVDLRGRQLGTSEAGAFTSYPPQGYLVPGVFRAAEPVIGDVPMLKAGSREARWATTHDNAARFVLPRVATAPQITGIEVGEVYGETRLALTFDRPLVMYDGTHDGLVGAGLTSNATNVQGFSFMLAKRVTDLIDRKLSGKNAEDVDPRAVATLGADGERLREYRFASGAVVAARAGAATGSIFMETDPNSPWRVFLTIVGRGHYLNPECQAIAVRFEGIGDPAGNVANEDFANRSVFRSAL